MHACGQAAACRAGGAAGRCARHGRPLAPLSTTRALCRPAPCPHGKAACKLHPIEVLLLGAPRPTHRAPHLRGGRVHADRLQVLQCEVAGRLAPPLARRGRPLLAARLWHCRRQCEQRQARARGDLCFLRMVFASISRLRRNKQCCGLHPERVPSRHQRRSGAHPGPGLLPTCLRRRSLGLVAASPSSRGVLRPPLRALSPPRESPLERELRERWYSCGGGRHGRNTSLSQKHKFLRQNDAGRNKQGAARPTVGATHQ